MINFLNQKFKEIHTMQEEIALDESLMKYKRRLSYFKQFNLLKRARIKFYKLCESKFHYCYDFKIFTSSDRKNFNDSASEILFKELLQLV